MSDSGFGTRAIHAGQEPDPVTGAIMTPIYQTSTYVQQAPAENKGYVYARGDNPTRNALQDCLASLEGAAHCTATSSGLGAESVVLTDLGSGARVVAGEIRRADLPVGSTAKGPLVITENETTAIVPTSRAIITCADLTLDIHRHNGPSKKASND